MSVGYAIGTQHAALLRLFEKWSKPMPSNPKRARGLGNEARAELTNVQMHIGDADRKLERLAKTDIDASNARVSLWQALVGIVNIFGLGRDESEGTNGNGHSD